MNMDYLINNENWKSNFEKYLTTICDLGLSLNGESSFSNSFKIIFHDSYFDFIPLLPTSYAIDDQLSKRIYQISVGACYPYLTVLQSNGPYFVRTKSSEIGSARALRFNFLPGTVERLVFDKLSDIRPIGSKIPLMKNLYYDVNRGNRMICITGLSGGGKTVMFLILAQCFNQLGKLIIIDPKLDDKLYRFSTKRKIPYFSPAGDQNDTNFVNIVTAELKRALDLIHKRQSMLIQNPSVIFKPYMLFIDEVLSLTATINKKSKDQFLGLLTKICVLGRATKVGVVISSQEISADVIDTASRDQMSLKILLTPNVDRESCRFLFKGLDDPSSIVIPNDGYTGRGIVQNVGENNMVLPFLAPLIKNLE